MSNINICRICLTTDVFMHDMINTSVHLIYKKLTDISIDQDDSRSHLICYLCYKELKKCQSLINKALRSEELLNQLLNANSPELIKSIFDQKRTSSLIISPIQAISLPEITDELTEETETKEVVKEEESLRDNDESDHRADSPELSDSEDDLPLKSISTGKLAESVRTKVRKREWKQRQRKEKGFKADYAREILLTKEQQLQELQQRAKSLNYKNSPMKCALCYKGFVDARAFENHKMRHEESSGAFACDICQLRYRSGRQARTHAVTSHARHYRCTRCDHVSHTANQAREHEKWHRGHTYECKLCGHAFRKPTSYLTHMRKRHPTQHACALCGDSFVGRHGLLMHQSKTHHKDEIQKENPEEPASRRFCAECNIQFASRDAWQRHILSSVRHTLATSDSVCPICECRVQSLPVHLREHEKALRRAAPVPADVTARLTCDQCPRLFINRSKLQAHINRIHLGLKYNKNIVCEVCGKKCTSNASLKYHQRTHTGEKPYRCGACDKRFADNNQLRIHTRTHTGERPYCCGVCEKRFSQKPALNRHYRVHTGAKPYCCQFCTKTFSQSNSMKLHVRTVHLKMPATRRNQRTDEKQTSVDTVNPA